MLQITPTIAIADWELVETFIRASGPGGQNVNKVSTAVELRFDMAGSPNLSDPVKARLTVIAGSRLTKDGVVVIRSDRFRSQDRNREDARDRLAGLIERAVQPPKPRLKTRPTKASKERRLESKSVRSGLKKTRRDKPDEE
jgi:ribosome-associated protein